MVVFALASLIPLPSPASYIPAGCADDITAPTRQENEAKNEEDAGDFGGAHYDYQHAVIYRANCADETTGRARQWNRLYEGMDYLALAAVNAQSELWKDDVDGNKEKAHQIANDLLGEGITADMRGLTQTLWDVTKPQ